MKMQLKIIYTLALLLIAAVTFSQIIEVEDDPPTVPVVQPKQEVKASEKTAPLPTVKNGPIFIFPVVGKTVWDDTYGAPRDGGKRKHIGIDIPAPRMRPIVAAFDGVVYPKTSSYQNSLTLVGDNGYTATYMHLNNDTPYTDDGKGTEHYAFPPGIVKGTRVKAGQHIAWNGDSGNAEGSCTHLHFELKINNKQVNPKDFLKSAAHIDFPISYSGLETAKNSDTKSSDVVVNNQCVGLRSVPTSDVKITDVNITGVINNNISKTAKAENLISLNSQPKELYDEWSRQSEGKLTPHGALANMQSDAIPAYARRLQALNLALGDARFYHIFERLLYNVLLANPRVNESILCDLGGYVYASKSNQLYVNLYINSSAVVNLGGKSVKVEQKTSYPWSDNNTITLKPGSPTFASLFFRVPTYTADSSITGEKNNTDAKSYKGFAVYYNGTEIHPYITQSGYAYIPRVWVDGDKIELKFDTPVKQVYPGSNSKPIVNEH